MLHHRQAQLRSRCSVRQQLCLQGGVLLLQEHKPPWAVPLSNSCLYKPGLFPNYFPPPV